MGVKTGRPRGRPRNGSSDLQGVPGTKPFGDSTRESLATYLLRNLPIAQRSKMLAELATGASTGDAAYASQIASRLAALKYVNELSGVVTVAQEKEAESTASIPQIIVEGEPPPRPGSVEALKLLATAKGSQYDQTFPPGPPDPPKLPQPFRSVVTVRES